MAILLLGITLVISSFGVAISAFYYSIAGLILNDLVSVLIGITLMILWFAMDRIAILFIDIGN